MRNNIVYEGADQLTYEIREIVVIAQKIEKTGVNISWENIGDPIAKGEIVPEWIKEIVSDTVKNDNNSYGYSPTRGLLETREYIAKERNLEGGIQITAEDILFFNGLGDAISKVYTYLNSKARVIGPNPAYSTHSSAEAGHADSPHITYKLDPNNHWYPDLKDLREKIKNYKNIDGILIVNPDNPTGMVYPENVIREIVAIAKEFKLFIISDEIYSNLCYGAEHKKLASVIDDVPGLAMRGISKEFPWPGARCGWIEFYNCDKDADFARYAKTLLDAKMLEVCSTTLPQKVLPRVMSDSRYYPYLRERNNIYKKKAEIAYDIFSKIPELIVHKPNGAFYMTVLFKDGVLNNKQKLLPANPEAWKIIEEISDTTNKLDKRFVYQLLASKGICVVPLSSGFNSDLNGFRITLLERDEEKFKKIVETIADSVKEYLISK
ncbi:MAG: pyridoxal phosphate-dependent aminotransferase [Candidatus Paceibacterota bacterium]|jgi:aspartate/methionine/tyrosine aminotransferase